MKNMWKYIMIGLVVGFAEWVFLGLFQSFFNGLDQTEALIVGAAFFLAFEIVICTGIIISKISHNKDK